MQRPYNAQVLQRAIMLRAQFCLQRTIEATGGYPDAGRARLQQRLVR